MKTNRHFNKYIGVQTNSTGEINNLTLAAGLLARSQYSEGPATGHLDTGFSWFLRA